ncbi:MAG: family 43 glycosylhydrolase [Clostridia bacterium]|nr:family 43 glycosylhydrolase [Clostridia bacterium]
MIEHGDYRYMFTSYGWLGSNYNTRVARAPLSTKFSENMGTQLVDANGVVMGTQQTLGSTSRTGITGYKLIGSYRLGDGTMTMTKDSASSGYYYSYSSDSAHVYYGPGHNSAISTDMGDFYVSHTRKDAIEGAATLQARKMLWTEDGWPVVSPLVYSGEIEQSLPKDMLLGTYDLATVGYTKMDGSSIYTGTNPNRNYDLPVVSSKVTLNADGTMADDLGTWEFDGDHKVTLTFAKDGNTAKDEFYKSGDVITMYALFGYDKDEKAPEIALTGTDQNHVTQFAKKLMNNVYESEQAKIITPIVVDKSNSGNPMLGFDANNNIMYAGDPAAMVDGDTVYLYAGHDTSTTEGYVMPEWVCYSSKDMENWTYHGKVMGATDVSWRNDNNSAWASQAIKYGDKYYLYFCTWDKTSSGKQSIGVAVADSPTGPFTDIGAPIVKGTLTEPETSGWNDIDPTVWVETVDGVEHRYLAWGNGIYYVCELNEDMISVKDLDGDGSITMNGDIKQQEFKNLPDGLGFTEAPFIYRRQDENGNYYGKYYMFGAFGWREQMGYVTADSMYGPWEYGGTLMPPTATSNTNHPSVIDFNGKTYFIYHNGSLPWGSGFRRVVCIEEFEFNADGSIDPIQETSTGLTGTASIITQDDNYLYYEAFVNPSGDDSYPLSKSVYIGRNMADMDTVKWEIVAGKADKANENYVSIQAVNKPGLYLAASSDYTLYLTADAAQNDTAMQSAMTFRTIAGLDGSEDSVTFESVSEPGYYITMQDGTAVLTKGKTPSACTFYIGSAENVQTPALAATVDKIWHEDNKTVHFRLNNALVYGTVNAIVAEYNTSGELIGVANKNKIDVTSASQFIDIDYTRAEDTSTLKLFVWNHMMPVAPVTEVKDTTSPYAMPEGYTSYFTFDEDLKDSLTEANGAFVATNIDGTAPTFETASALKDGYKGKAIEFTGANSYGVNLGNVITNSKYTLAFRMKTNAFTAFTSGVFIDSGSKTDEKWVSAPFGYQSGGSTMIWSKSGSTYLDIVSGTPTSADTWHQVVIAADGTTGSLYIDGALVASGSISDIVTTTTNTYLGVNYWDTPFNGLIDDMYIYNGTTLTSEQIENLYFATK